MAASGHLGFLNSGNPDLLATSREPMCIIALNFVKIGQTVAEITRFFNFSRWRPSAILDVFAAFLDHPRNIFGGL